MEKVVYLLGAGFSAPLGLPVMSNFRFKAEDMFWAEPEKYAHFEKVFETIRKIAVGQSYYDTDLFNIEDVLSILEMEDFLGDDQDREGFAKFIIDVIEHHTPEFEVGSFAGNWWDFPFGSDFAWQHYASFVCGLNNFKLFPINRAYARDFNELYVTRQERSTCQYSVLTLNYDKILENFCDLANRTFGLTGNPLEFYLGNGGPDVEDAPALAKLHGSTDTGTIVPPTWSKGRHQEIAPAWKLAYRALSDATQIRILGYSLPVADTYIKFLLKAAVVPRPRIRRIDVICRDPDGSVRRRYDDFMKFGYYRFMDGDLVEYLRLIDSKHHRISEMGEIRFDGIEAGHEEFFAQINRRV